MDGFVASLVAGWFAISSVVTVSFAVAGTYESSVFHACEKHGEWQAGQHRITCTVVTKEKQ